MRLLLKSASNNLDTLVISGNAHAQRLLSDEDSSKKVMEKYSLLSEIKCGIILIYQKVRGRGNDYVYIRFLWLILAHLDDYTGFSIAFNARACVVYALESMK